ncbi:MAG: hypothetical protein IJ916_02880 [Paludibacteraceae bacterium]|nr:hypothetical protein [Paludibacteraceae bacterium]
MQKLYNIVVKCPAEILLSIFFVLYLSVYEPFGEGSWPPPTKDAAMVVALQFTMVVRLIVSNLFSSRLGIIASLLVGVIVAILFWFHPIVDGNMIVVSYFISLIVCFFSFKGDRMEQVVKTLMLIITTVVSFVVVSFISIFILEIKNECLGPADDLIAEIYAFVVGTIVYVIGYQIINKK